MKLIKTANIAILLSFSFLINSYAQLSEQQHSDIVKNLDIYNSFFKELIINYVDTLNSTELTENAISSVLKDLDPYNEYIPSQNMQDFQFITTGEYGGIGSVISMQNDTVIIRDPYEGMPAALSGLIPGDRILAIDGEEIVGKDTKHSSDRLKGQPNTSLKIKFLRPGETKPREITIERKRIHIDPVTYYGVLDGGIGYIYLSTFTTESAQSLKKALLDLTSNFQITSLIIDVRGNVGGVVDE